MPARGKSGATKDPAEARRPSRLRSLEDLDSLRTLVRNLKEGIYITNSHGEILDASPAFLDMMGVPTLEELRTYNVRDFLMDPDIRASELELLASEGSVREFELRVRRSDGQVRTVLDTAYTARDPETGEVLYHGILVDITLRKLLEAQLVEQSIRDPLTGCFNRRYLPEFESRARHSRHSWGCIILDIDHFKRYNDEHGHQAGDQVLVKISRFLMRQTRAEEGVVRMGGDEFLVLLALSDAKHVESAAARLKAAAAQEGLAAFSLGWAVRESGERLEKTIGRADARLLGTRSHRREVSDDRHRRPGKHDRRRGA
jgi:diguanylate cyclase (GGDEF)-like protein/PAS domain S-box-containing protein